MSPYEHDRTAAMEPHAVVVGDTLTLPSQKQLAALGRDDAALAGPRRSDVNNLTRWHDYAAAINRAFPANPEADADLDKLMAQRANHATRPLPRRVP